MAANKLTLEINVPLQGMAKSLRWFENEHGRALILGIEVPSDCQGVQVGMYEAGLGSVFIDETLGVLMQQLGIAMETAGATKYGPKWKVIGAPLISLLKTEDGKERTTTLERIDGVGTPAATPQAAPPAAQANAGQPHPAGPPPGQPPATNGAHNGAERAADPAAMKAKTLTEWKRLATAYHKALEIAASGFCNALDCESTELDQRAVGTVANSIMITADRSGLIGRTYAGIFKKNGDTRPTPSPEDQIAPGEGIGEDDDDLPF